MLVPVSRSYLSLLKLFFPSCVLVILFNTGKTQALKQAAREAALEIFLVLKKTTTTISKLMTDANEWMSTVLLTASALVKVLFIATQPLLNKLTSSLEVGLLST